MEAGWTAQCGLSLRQSSKTLDGLICSDQCVCVCAWVFFSVALGRYEITGGFFSPYLFVLVSELFHKSTLDFYMKIIRNCVINV